MFSPRIAGGHRGRPQLMAPSRLAFIADVNISRYAFSFKIKMKSNMSFPRTRSSQRATGYLKRWTLLTQGTRVTRGLSAKT